MILRPICDCTCMAFALISSFKYTKASLFCWDHVQGKDSLGERPFLCPHCRCPVETPASQGRAVKPDMHISLACNTPVGGWARDQEQGAPDTLCCASTPSHTCQTQGPQDNLPGSTFLCRVEWVQSPCLSLPPPTQPPRGNSPSCMSSPES